MQPGHTLIQVLGPVLVLACGNPLRGDDGVALQIAEAMEWDPKLRQCPIISSQQLLPEHAKAISRAGAVLFLDCSATAQPGQIEIVKLQPAATLPSILTHHLDPPALLRLTLDLYQTAPAQAFAIAIGGGNFEPSESLSPAVAGAIPAALAAIRNILKPAP